MHIYIHTTQQNTTPYYTILHHTNHTILYYTILQNTTLYYTTLHYRFTFTQVPPMRAYSIKATLAPWPNNKQPYMHSFIATAPHEMTMYNTTNH